MMKHFIHHTVASVILVLGLAACSGNITKQAAYTCTGAAALIDVAAEGVRAGKISLEEKPKFAKAIDKVAVVCENPLAPTSASMKELAIAELVKLLAEKGLLK